MGSWTGTTNDASTATVNTVVTLASDHTVSVQYVELPPPCFMLSLSRTGSGDAPAASPSSSAGCSGGQYHAAEQIQLTANPAAGWTVSGWTGTDDDADTATTNTVTMPASAHTVTVHYVEDPVVHVLLVDDDNQAPDVIATYLAALSAVEDNLSIALWDTFNSDDEPDAATLSQYDAVVWFTGAEYGGAAGPSAASEAALAAYLDAGGCLFLSSQDYLWDRGGGSDVLTPFMADHLGVDAGLSDQAQTTVTGAGPVFQGLGTYTLSYPFSNLSDLLTPAGGAAAACEAEDGAVAVSKDGGVYKTTWWAFPFEALPTAQSRLEAMQRFLDWCLGNASSVLFADDFETGDSSKWDQTVSP